MPPLRIMTFVFAMATALAHNNTAASDQYHVCDSDLCSEIITDCKQLSAEYHEHGCCGNPDKLLQYVQVGNIHTHNCADLKAQFQQCKTIRDHAGYKPSSAFSLGAPATNAFGDNCSSFTWGHAPLQINLEYAARFDMIGNAFGKFTLSSQNYWNGQAGRSMPNGNWVDPDAYTITICPPSTSSMTMGVNGGTPATSIVQGIQWTVSGWGQTVLAGTVQEIDGNVKLNLVGYFPFSGEVPTNVQEAALAGRTRGHATAEVLSYTASGTTTADLGEGQTFKPELRKYTRCAGGTNYRE